MQQLVIAIQSSPSRVAELAQRLDADLSKLAVGVSVATRADRIIITADDNSYLTPPGKRLVYYLNQKFRLGLTRAQVEHNPIVGIVLTVLSLAFLGFFAWHSWVSVSEYMKQSLGVTGSVAGKAIYYALPFLAGAFILDLALRLIPLR